MMDSRCRRGGRLPISMPAVAFAVSIFALPALGLDLIEADLDLDTLFAPAGDREAAVTPLFSQMLAADLNGDGRKEIVLPGSDGRLRLLRLVNWEGRPDLATWTIINPYVEGDRPLGTCYLKAGKAQEASPPPRAADT